MKRFSKFRELTASYTDKFNDSSNNIYIKDFDLIHRLRNPVFTHEVIILRLLLDNYTQIRFDSIEKPWDWDDVK